VSLKYIKQIVKGYTELSNDVDDVVAIYLANMTDDYFIELYRKYFSRVSV
jgi:dGTP triphosphohydrolase